MKSDTLTNSVFNEDSDMDESFAETIEIHLNKSTLHKYRVIRRNGKLVDFDPIKISTAITKAFVAVEGNTDRANMLVSRLTYNVISSLESLHKRGKIRVEDIQDQVEQILMTAGEYKIARTYIAYRDEHAKLRAERGEMRVLFMINEQGIQQAVTEKELYAVVNSACEGLDFVSAKPIIEESMKNLFDGISESDIMPTLLMSARALIEKEPNYTYVAARLLFNTLQHEALNFVSVHAVDKSNIYLDYFSPYIRCGLDNHLLSPDLGTFDLNKLTQAIVPERDFNFTYLGLQTLYDRYFLKVDKIRFELPQAFFMRVAMGLAIHETDKENKAIEFYHLLSNFDFMCSTPTLFNSGTRLPQLSSCYVSTVHDSTEGITQTIADNAKLSKFAGGIGNDWTMVRGMGSHIASTNGKSGGIIPFMKMAESTLQAFNQSGKRKGSGCAYLEIWHIDVEDFLELRKNTGDERRRTHDMDTAAWIPDLFMERVENDEKWTLFSPNECYVNVYTLENGNAVIGDQKSEITCLEKKCVNIHELYGKQFKQAYEFLEKRADSGKIKIFKKVNAVTLWRKMLGMLFETGHPWICFKDAINIRNTQSHIGAILSSNLCTEITEVSKAGNPSTGEGRETAVCNLGSINLEKHIVDGQLDTEKLEKTVSTAMRMLDNVIDINFYPVESAQKSNKCHRPVGLGMMGFQNALFKMRIPYNSQKAVDFADKVHEHLSYYAISASTDLAEQRGIYPSFEGSLWSQGILPIDSIDFLAESRGGHLDMKAKTTLDWDSLRTRVKTVGMRNSNCMAIAPTATISNIVGTSQSIEPVYQNLFVKSNLSGEFTIVNKYLVDDLKALDLWNESMIVDLKYFGGSVSNIKRIPKDLKALYATAFEIDSVWLIKAAARRQKWIDQSQSLNIYLKEPSGKKLDSLYRLAWFLGLKTTYYLRTLGATRVQPSTVKPSKDMCYINNPECDSCQ